ncbi:S8 family serine peptidase [Actinosynnema sp. NPDC020468]|uniref:S8 family serine peptidase n=1 Tax=Actinosynnema sp. NPDC020468 TaxID=3154488 RepID=UPI00340467F9
MGSANSGRRVAWGATILAIGLVTGGTGVSTAAPGTAATPDEVTPGAVGVTLITGDRVALTGARVGSLTPGPGRERIGFRTFTREGHLHVVPEDALRPLAAGRVDLRLFDVTGLVQAGYDDAARDSVPLIVQGAPGPVRTAGASVTADLPAAGAVAATAEKSRATATWNALLADAGVREVWLDGLRQPSLDRSTRQIGAPAAWDAGYTGKGVKVAVLDTGVDGAHADLAGREIAEKNFTTDPDNTDSVGHGTHVAATIASRDAKYRGVAPDASLLDGKVCFSGGCAESWILAGLQWAVDQGADVVNLSLGGADRPGLDPLEEAVNALSASSGTLFVVAAGNSGAPGTVGSPGSADAALTVGAVDRDDSVASFSSRGPRAGDDAVKPDVTAPGVGIVAAKSGAGTIGDPVDPTHVALSGTSMATPHVAGAAALLAQQHPDWTGARIKAALTASAKPSAGATAFDQGAGRIDLAKAITTAVTADPVSVGLGVQQYPHTDDVPVSKVITYRNPGGTPLGLTLTVESTGPDGKPASVFAVSPSSVTVPAGGEATVSVTGDTRKAALDGAYSGVVVASGAAAVRTPVSITREVESYDLTLNHVGADGRPTRDYTTLVLGLDNSQVLFPYEEDGSVTVRVPKGEYFAQSQLGRPETGTAFVFAPALTVGGPTTTAVDARSTAPVKITVPDPAAITRLGDFTVTRRVGGYAHSFGTLLPDGFAGTSFGSTGPVPDQVTTVVGLQAEGTPVGDASVAYRFAWQEKGVPKGFTRAPARRDLATVRTSYGSPTANQGHAFNPLANGDGGWSWVAPVRTASIDHLTTGTKWISAYLRFADNGPGAFQFSSGEQSLRPGREYRERYNFPNYGPTLPKQAYPYLSRSGDTISFGMALWGDSDGHPGGADVTAARTALYRDGVKVREASNPASGVFTVPAGPGDFRIEAGGERVAGTSDFATKVTGEWTFRSDTTPGTGRATPLPLSVVRFTPKLTDTGATPAGRLLAVPFVVEQQESPTAGRVREVAVEVSFDDGATWSKVPVAGRTALVRNPDRPGAFASLRVKGADTKGNTFAHTVIHTYRLG